MRHQLSNFIPENLTENLNPNEPFLENDENINPYQNIKITKLLAQRKNKNKQINQIEKTKNGAIRYFGKNIINSNNIELNNTNINGLKEKEKISLELKSSFIPINHYNYSQPLLPIEKCVLESSELEQINNPQYCIEYSKEIFSYLRANENLNMPFYSNSILSKGEISERSRKILLDWIVSVHSKFNLLPNTLFLTVNLIDRMIEKKKAFINSFQLLGATALHIAAKYEEIYPPEIRDYIIVSSKAFTKEDVINMEMIILDILKFDILCISPYVFLDRIYFISKENCIDVYYLSSMFIEFCFLSTDIMKNKQSLIASSMFYLALKIIYPKRCKIWDDKLLIHTGYKENKIKNVIKEFINYFKGNYKDKKGKLNAIFVKYNLEKYGKVAEKFIGRYK